ncbi:hypothetical protein [Aureimonas sp. AU20]|uniref:hypothetical protein n=1 Tax=Aureimonas sp. AU20 TaxID=1349819 RepID=UPI0011E028BC|nr:hypothetical protein [Aureimonas sp. AU20]
MKVFRKGRSARGGWKSAKAQPRFQPQTPQCAVSFSIGSSGGGTSLWLEFEPTDFEAMAVAMMQANPVAAREAFRVANGITVPEG